ncbi:MAG: hypothetical protein IJ228_11550 [Succinivibrio sp.]|nr:hypothetical protein [Succinivibrio sp.]
MSINYFFEEDEEYCLNKGRIWELSQLWERRLNENYKFDSLVRECGRSQSDGDLKSKTAELSA